MPKPKSQTILPDGLSYRLAHQNLALVILHRPDRRGKGFEGPHLGNDLYAVARFVTYVQLVDEAGIVLTEGKAICAPNDEFDPELGYRIAVGRAYKDYVENYQVPSFQLHYHVGSSEAEALWWRDGLYG